MTEQKNTEQVDTSTDSQETIAQKIKDGVYIRTIKSFVKREGRLTKGQQGALDQYWPIMGLEHKDGLIDFSAVFGNDNPVVAEIGFGMGKSLVEMAKASPEINFIGVEVHKPGVGACISYAVDEGVSNLKVYEHDAIEVLADCIP
ncbi:MAG: tRNA (guanine(46)-N(7))-methyltransferase TrmB, partial [Psychrobium sp.]|nr:tRNA (guanine(46)-N(7))-methyltransferase TrmB [Psychrobium sp.]